MESKAKGERDFPKKGRSDLEVDGHKKLYINGEEVGIMLNSAFYVKTFSGKYIEPELNNGPCFLGSIIMGNLKQQIEIK